MASSCLGSGYALVAIFVEWLFFKDWLLRMASDGYAHAKAMFMLVLYRKTPISEGFVINIQS